MEKQLAYGLLDYIELSVKPGSARVQQIGNGEYVVILIDHGYFLWGFDDWIQYGAKAAKGEEVERIAV